MTSTFSQVQALVQEARAIFAGSSAGGELETLGARLQGPLRVAIAGRVKAGKSTLLNALVGERLAPTDAGECTKIVSWYREGIGYGVEAVLKNGDRRPLRFSRDLGALSIDLLDIDADEIGRLEIEWPASSLRAATLIDTPGLASINEENSLRTQEFMTSDSALSDGADAVIYLMRHLHRRDVEFLGAFLDRTTSGTSPVNSIGVLSRADEIGSCRLDALQSARRVADRYQADPVLSTLCAAIVPVAGLIAETGQTLTEGEAGFIRQLVQTDREALEELLLSADDFCDPGRSSLTVEIRRELLSRLGLFGLRMLIGTVQRGEVTSAGEMAQALVAASGLSELQRIVREQFLPRAQVLKAKNALARFAALASAMTAVDPEQGRRLVAEAERIQAGADEFQALRLEHLVRSNSVRLDANEVDEVMRMVDRRNREAWLAASATGTLEERQTVALTGVDRWRTKGSDPLADVVLREAAETMARWYEAAYLELVTSGSQDPR